MKEAASVRQPSGEKSTRVTFGDRVRRVTGTFPPNLGILGNGFFRRSLGIFMADNNSNSQGKELSEEDKARNRNSARIIAKGVRVVIDYKEKQAELEKKKK